MMMAVSDIKDMPLISTSGEDRLTRTWSVHRSNQHTSDHICRFRTPSRVFSSHLTCSLTPCADYIRVTLPRDVARHFISLGVPAGAWPSVCLSVCRSTCGTSQTRKRRYARWEGKLVRGWESAVSRDARFTAVAKYRGILRYDFITE